MVLLLVVPVFCLFPRVVPVLPVTCEAPLPTLIPIYQVRKNTTGLYLVCRIYLATLDSREHLLGKAVEAHVDIFVGLSWSFDIQETVGGSETLCLFFWDFPLWIKVGFVAHKNQHKVLAGTRARLRDEAAELLERVPVCNIKSQYRADSSSEVWSSDWPKGFLASRVPDLKLDDLASDVKSFRPELNPDCGIVVVFELFIGELEHQARLSNI